MVFGRRQCVQNGGVPCILRGLTSVTALTLSLSPYSLRSEDYSFKEGNPCDRDGCLGCVCNEYGLGSLVLVDCNCRTLFS
jgi:hypothetical protein